MRGKLMNPDIVGLSAREGRGEGAGSRCPRTRPCSSRRTRASGASTRSRTRSSARSSPSTSSTAGRPGAGAASRSCATAGSATRSRSTARTRPSSARSRSRSRSTASSSTARRSQGAVGYTTNLFPSMTLGCGSFGGNITSDNIGPQHLLNIKRVARVRAGLARRADVGRIPAPAAGRGARAGAEPVERSPRSERRPASVARDAARAAAAPRESRANPLFPRGREEHHCDSTSRQEESR